MLQRSICCNLYKNMHSSKFYDIEYDDYLQHTYEITSKATRLNNHLKQQHWILDLKWISKFDIKTNNPVNIYKI